ncbi:MAG: bifunctional homocysteine S-methyltransferase/methylenetetrahydrofolate reductase [Actinomycetota bacterium]
MERESFKKLIAGGPILGDGGTGTALVSSGIPIPSTLDALNLTAPEAVSEVHKRFVAAGARFIETNTFGANRFKLGDHGYGRLVFKINALGVRIAREAGSELVGGSVGPLGVRLVPYGRVKADEAREVFMEQIAALTEAGVDLLFIETQTDVAEAEQAVLAAREVCSLPVVVSFAFTRDDRTLLGDTIETVAARLGSLEVDAVGVNCSEGPAQVLRLITAMRAVLPDVPSAALPNGGQPRRLAGRLIYQATPEYMASYARRFRDAGVSIIGGCCGTLPEHIQAMGAALAAPRGATSSPRINVDGGADEFPQENGISLSSGSPGAEFARSLAGEGPTFVVEMDPPRSVSASRLVAGAETLAKAGAHAVSIADSPMAKMRMSPWAACHLIQQEASVATVLHFPTRGRNLLRIQGDLLAAYALGIRNIFVCMGDPTAIGDYPQAADHADVTPSGLIGLVKHGLNMGQDRLGASIGDATQFLVGCAVDLAAADLDREVRVLHRKIVAGADFAYSQPLFSAKPVKRFRDRYEDRFGELHLPILCGLLPTVSSRHAEFLQNEVPGIKIPDEIMRRMAAAGSRSEDEGLEIAEETGREVLFSAAGGYVMPPFGRYHLAAELIERLDSGSRNPVSRPLVAEEGQEVLERP